MPPSRRRLSGAVSALSTTPSDDGEAGGMLSPPPSGQRAMPLGRSYIAHAAPSASTWKASSSWTHDSGDIREGSARLGQLSLIDAMTGGGRSSPAVAAASPPRLPPSPRGPPGRRGALSPGPAATDAPAAVSSGLTRMLKTHSQHSVPSSVASFEGEAAGQADPPLDRRPAPPTPGTRAPSDESSESRTLQAVSAPASPPLKALVDSTEPPSERTPLLPATPRRRQFWPPRLPSFARKHGAVSASSVGRAALAPVQYLPSTLLGVLMNVLDGVSYGLVTFPTLPVFAGFGGIGVSMFFVSCITSQLVTTSRSVFRGGNGSMMIEVVPFLHSMCFTINYQLGDDNPGGVVATSMVAIALSSVLTGLTFFLLGSLRLGVLLQHFPRHVLVGCIGGVGAFLLITGLQVTSRIEEDDELGDNAWQTVQAFFADDLLPLWTIPLGLAVLLRLATARYTHPLVFPSAFLVLPLVFYGVVAALGVSTATLREHGWLFDLGADVDSPWWKFWTLFDFGATDLNALLATLPTQFALVFFAILHVPINVPALALSIGNDSVQTDAELVNHGLSNVLAGCLGTVPNYLCYVNSVLFYRVGGDSRLASTMLAIATGIVMMSGTTIIAALPVMEVGALIYILGIDLLKEAVYDTWGRVNHFEYATIWAIILVMTLSDFVTGIGVGILVACLSFVVSSANQRAVRFVQSGATARSTVRRHPQQGKFLREVGSQIRVLGLEGQLFFGTATGVEATIRGLFETDMRYLVLDFGRVYGIDFSAAEAFLRLHRLCRARSVVLVLCACPPDSAVGRALRAVDLWPGSALVDGVDDDDGDDAGAGGGGGVEAFATLNDALEHCENAQLRALYANDLRPSRDASPLDSSAIAVGPHAGIGVAVVAAAKEGRRDFSTSPRRQDLLEAAKRTVSSAELAAAADAGRGSEPAGLAEPVALLLQALRPYGEDLIAGDPAAFFLAVRHAFDAVRFDEGEVVWRVGDDPACLYIIQSGILKVSYRIGRGDVQMVESMMPATVAGEMTFIAGQPRYAEMVAERSAVLWRLTAAAFERLERDDVARARVLRKIFIRNAREMQDTIVGHLIHSL